MSVIYNMIDYFQEAMWIDLDPGNNFVMEEFWLNLENAKRLPTSKYP